MARTPAPLSPCRKRRLLASVAPAILLAALPLPGLAEPLAARSTNTFGLPGLVDLPAAEVMPDGTLGVTISRSELAWKNSIVFQALPRMTVALRYSRIDSDSEERGVIWDRSFDIRYQVIDESGWRPAVAVGLQDFMGTGIYSGEYIVATKTVTPDIRVTAGLGWGRLASRGGLGSPFGDRPGPDEGLGGRPNYDQWFRGEVAPFFGVSWQATDKLSLAAEYSGDAYICETGNEDGTCPRNPWVSGDDPLKNRVNLGFTYRFNDLYQVGGYVLGGSRVGLQFSFALDPRKAPHPSGLEKAPQPVRPRVSPGADPEGWAGAWSADPTAQPALQKALGDALAKEGQRLEGMALSATRAEVRIANSRYLHQAEAIGRTARLMTRALPPSVETFVITSSAKGMPTSSVTLRRSDIERLENTASGEIAKVAQITDAAPRVAGYTPSEGAYPRLNWRLAPYFVPGLFDPDEPLRYEIGAALSGSYEAMPGLILSGEIRQRIAGSLGDNRSTWESSSPDHVPVVRGDSALFYGLSGPTIPRLTAAWYAHPTETTYARVTAGMLEPAFGGVSAEVLWKPNDSRLALGAEINRVRKREYEQRFGFEDYEVTTGHLSAYYDFGSGFVGQVDAGQYLAGDRGVTVALNREFANGWKVGAYVTKTDMSAEDFGEGSYDKGISILVPLSWGLGTPSQKYTGGSVRSMNRDGAARLDVEGRLYDTVRDSQKGKIYQGWGNFWR